MMSRIGLEAHVMAARLSDLSPEDSNPSLSEFYVRWDSVSDAELTALEECLQTATSEEGLRSLLQSCPKLLVQNLAGGHGRWVLPASAFPDSRPPDFTIGQKSSIGYEWKAVKLSSLSARICDADGMPTSELNQAIDDILAWQRWLGSRGQNVTEPRDQGGLGLIDCVSRMPGLILIGREVDLRGGDNEVRRQFLRDHEIQIRTYDWLLRAAGNRESERVGMQITVAHEPEGEPICVGVQRNFRFQCKGDYWDICFGGRHALLSDSKGLQYIHDLLGNPNPTRAASAIALAGGDLELADVEHTFDPVMDDETRRQCMARLKEISQERDTAEKNCDQACIERLDDEVDEITEQLAAATGLRGRDRRLGPASPARRASNAVRQAMRRAYEHMRKSECNLSHLVLHLNESIRPEGNAFAYRPEPTAPDWQL